MGLDIEEIADISLAVDERIQFKNRATNNDDS